MIPNARMPRGLCIGELLVLMTWRRDYEMWSEDELGVEDTYRLVGFRKVPMQPRDQIQKAAIIQQRYELIRNIKL